jgi:hypothetical protein
MRTLLATVSLLVAVSAFDGAAAQNYPWCARYAIGQFDGGTNCGFVTLAQCQATVSGVGGYCTRNLWYAPAPKRKSSRSRG